MPRSLIALIAKRLGEMRVPMKIAVEGKGSATAPPALLDGTAQFGPMTSAEADALEKEIRLSGFEAGGRGRCTIRLCQQGKSDQVPLDGAGRSDILVDAEGQWWKEYRDLG